MRVFRFSCLFLFVSCTGKNPPVDKRKNSTLPNAAIATGAFQLRLAEGDTPEVVVNGDQGNCAAWGPRWTSSNNASTCNYPGNDSQIPMYLSQSTCANFGGVYQVGSNAASNLTDQRDICYLDRSLFKRGATDTDPIHAPGPSADSAQATDPSLDPKPDPTDPNSVGTGKTPDPSPKPDISDPTDPNSVGTGKTPQ